MVILATLRANKFRWSTINWLIEYLSPGLLSSEPSNTCRFSLHDWVLVQLQWFFSELNKSEVSFNYQENRLKNTLTFIFFRSLAWRLCYFTIHDPSIHGSTMHNSCKNHPKMLKLYWENYVNICPQHHIESDGVFMNLLAFKYMVNIMNHYSLFSSNSSGTSHNKPKVNLEKAVP